MARDYLAVIRQVESQYSKALGTATLNAVQQNQDEPLRRSLVGYANQVLRDLEKVNRWRLGFGTQTVLTTASTSTVTLTFAFTYIHRAYWRHSTGRIVPLELMDQNEPRLIFGDGPNAIPGAPQYYALGVTTGGESIIQLYPTPDNTGPDTNGNYSLIFEYYRELPQIVEVVSTTTLASNLASVANVQYLIANGYTGLNPGGDSVTIRESGYPSGISGPYAFDDLTAVWTGFNIGPDAIALPSNVPRASASAQTFLGSVNWVITKFPQVLLYGMLREVASYLKSKEDYSIWEARYQAALEALMEWDQQSRHDVEVLAGSVGGQQQPLLRGIDWPNIYEVRGGN